MSRLETIKTSYANWHDVCEDYRGTFADIQWLLGALEAAQKDAKRYRWLLAQHWIEPEAVFRLGLSGTDDFSAYEIELAAAIDSKLAARTPDLAAPEEKK